LIHMPTHIDVLIGDYENCVHYNLCAIEADMQDFQNRSDTSGIESFYFGYMMHNYHMAIYGCILGGMEQIGMDTVTSLYTNILNESLFQTHVELAPYFESYAALDIHLMVRFGRWKSILNLSLPQDPELMLYRTASIYYARALAFAALGDVSNAKHEADQLDSISQYPSAHERILHNNTVDRLLEVDCPMVRGEIAYREENYKEAFRLLRKAVTLQDALKFDEPWGTMQPIRHALGGLLLEQNHIKEAESVFRQDLKRHPKNPWGLVGLIHCLKQQRMRLENISDGKDELKTLETQLMKQRQIKWADFNISVSCECCQHENNR